MYLYLLSIQWVFFVSLKDKTADEVARGILEFVRLFGPPKRILSDQEKFIFYFKYQTKH